MVLFWIYGTRPLVAEPWQWADDGLYLRQAEAFVRWLHGQEKQWLGQYDDLILSKAPLFAIWMGGLHILQLPLRLAEYALVLLLPWLFRAAVRPVVNLSAWQLVITGTCSSRFHSCPWSKDCSELRCRLPSPAAV